MRVSYHPDYYVELPAGHPFPMAKFPDLHAILTDSAVIARGDIVRPKEAGLDLLRLVHTEEYLWKLDTGNLSPAEERRLGIPWTEPLWRRSRLAVSGTVNAGLMALEDGYSGNLAGGTHHAFPDHGQGFCVLNDVAIAIRRMTADGRIRRALVVDLDVHQGNGTASIFEPDAAVYTFSMHGEKNFPARKTRSNLDVGLPCGCGDERYLDTLADTLPGVIDAARPDCVFYLAGVDPVAGDRYGRMMLSEDGLADRDRFVIDRICAAGIPLVLLLSGGYADTPFRTAELHAVAFRTAVERYEGRTGVPGQAPAPA
ncbi:MAG: histone deacetylase [Gammaproteobacteria bacterium]|jgi:acetoin utilization deacetylase AcuC-like enzyme